MTAYTIIMIRQILWGVGIFTLGMLVGYMLKVVMINYERIKARKEERVVNMLNHKPERRSKIE